MNPRERVLLIVVACLGVGFGGWWAYRQYTGKLASLDADIRKAEEDLDKAETARREAQTGQADWRDFGKQTFSMEANEVKNLLRDELYRIADRAKLRNANVLPGRPAASQSFTASGARMSWPSRLQAVAAGL